MKILIIILYPFKFRNFDSERFEIKDLKAKNEVYIFELIDIFYPNFKKAYKKEKRKNKIIQNINSIKKLFHILGKIKNKQKKMLILNFIKNDSFKGYFVNNYLNKNFNTMNFFNPGVSTFENSVRTRNISLIKKISIFFTRWRETSQKIKGKLLFLLVEYFQTNEKYCFIAGKKPLEKISNKLIKNNITVVKEIPGTTRKFL